MLCLAGPPTWSLTLRFSHKQLLLKGRLLMLDEIQDLIAIVSGLRKRGVGFASLHEALDTTTPGGRLDE